MTRRALVLGTNGYNDPEIQPLKGAINDAAEVHAFFKYVASYDDVEFLPEADFDTIQETAERLTKGLGPGDLFVLYFAGHGTEFQGRHLLLCRDVRYSWLCRAQQHTVPVDLLRDVTNQPGIDRIFILDACRTDLLKNSRTPGSMGMKGEAALRDAVAQARPRGRGSFAMLCSCSQNEQAREIPEVRNGLFTKALLAVIRQAADARKGVVVSDVLASQIGVKMSELARQYRLDCEQTPWIAMAGPAPILLPKRVPDKEAPPPDIPAPDESHEHRPASIEREHDHPSQPPFQTDAKPLRIWQCLGAAILLLIVLVAVLFWSGVYGRRAGQVTTDSNSAVPGITGTELRVLEQENAALKNQIVGKESVIDALRARLMGTRLPAELVARLEDLASKHAEVTCDANQAILTFKTDLMFEKGSDMISTTAMETVRSLCMVLHTPEAQGFDLVIAGHVDDIPIQRPETRMAHPTNWHLAAHRAIALLSLMQDNGIEPSRMSARTFGQYRPLAPNMPDKRGNPKNRRVQVWLVPRGT